MIQITLHDLLDGFYISSINSRRDTWTPTGITFGDENVYDQFCEQYTRDPLLIVKYPNILLEILLKSYVQYCLAELRVWGCEDIGEEIKFNYSDSYYDIKNHEIINSDIEIIGKGNEILSYEIK